LWPDTRNSGVAGAAALRAGRRGGTGSTLEWFQCRRPRRAGDRNLSANRGSFAPAGPVESWRFVLGVYPALKHSLCATGIGHFAIAIPERRARLRHSTSVARHTVV